MEWMSRVWEHLLGRVAGPLDFRFILQPTIAIVLAVRAGIADARAHRSPYLWTVLSHPLDSPQLLRDGFHDVTKVFILAIGFDLVYSWIVFRWIYPVESLLVAVTLALIPYALVRGPVTRLRSKRLR